MRELGSGQHTRVGLVEWFRPGEYEHVDRVLSVMSRMGIECLRTSVSWAEYRTSAGRRWYNWLFPRLARRADLLPCVMWTPSARRVESGMTSSMPAENEYAQFLDRFITDHGEHFTFVELRGGARIRVRDGAEPASAHFSALAAAAQRAQEFGKKTVLGGTFTTTPSQLDLLARDGVLQYADAVGVDALGMKGPRVNALGTDTFGMDRSGLSGYPYACNPEPSNWSRAMSAIRRALARHDIGAEIWVTEAGYSTSKGDEYAQLQHFAALLNSPAERVYWHSAFDADPDLPLSHGFNDDERPYHFGLFRLDGRPKLLPRIWSDEGLEPVIALAELGRWHGTSTDGRRRGYDAAVAGMNGGGGATNGGTSANGQASVDGGRAAKGGAVGTGRTHGDGIDDVASSGRLAESSIDGHVSPSSGRLRYVVINGNGSAASRYTLITGGAGFIGTNMAERLLEAGRRVRILDNLSRPGVEKNLQWLCRRYGERVEVQIEDIRDPRAVREAVRRADQVYHFAAQVAVTTSTEYPREDFEINVCGTLNVLEAIRSMAVPPPLLFTSTNKVYGSLDDVEVHLEEAAYRPVDPEHARGIGSDRRLDFHSPYGCSKGAADTYVLDYCRMFELPTVVFRMSCIYGPHQFGTEDQGWIAHFLFRALRGEAITIYGDGRQVRDVLFVEDLIRSMVMALNEIEHVRGRAFNVGGGAVRAVSLLQVLKLIEELHGELPEITFADWRPSDQKFYVSDTEELERATGWKPIVDVRDGIGRLYEWIVEDSPAHSLRTARLK